MADTYPSTGVDVSTAPAIGIIAIDYSSDQEFTKRVRGLLITTAGTLNVVMADGSTGAVAVHVGYHPLEVREILNSGSSTAVGWALV
jgi:hypothetical protein